MKRPILVYILMTLVALAGVWAILAYGQRLRAPEDLAGQWELREARVMDDLAPGQETTRMVVEQSGRYFIIRLGRRRGIDLRLVEQGMESDAGIERVQLHLAGDGADLIFEGQRGGDEFVLKASGALEGRWIARRTHRTYPVDDQRRASARAPAEHVRD